MLSSILKASSYRVGRFNSPHLVSVLDSITIDDVPVSEDRYTEIRKQVEAADTEHSAGASSFERLTAIALLIFEDAKVDIAVVEVGMGGRLDATNVIPDQCILVSALTAVELDHQAFLGTTVADIAFEKASIARRGRPFVLGPQIHTDVEGVARKVVEDARGQFMAAVLPSRRDWDPTVDGEQLSGSLLSHSTFQGAAQPVEALLPPFSAPLRLSLPLPGDHQLDNLGTVLGIVSALLSQSHATYDLQLGLKQRITAESIARGVRSTSWPGRLSFHKIALPLASSAPRGQGLSLASDYLVLADGAHNPSSASTLGKFITQLLDQTLQAATANDNPRTITLSFILALSHSPPKTPLQTLTPLLSPLDAFPLPSNVQVRFRVALLKFSAPESMPWVIAEAPSDVKDAISSLLPQAEIWMAEDDTGTEAQGELRKALDWAAQGQRTEADEVGEGLVVVAGSLYLVADFYRVLRTQHMEHTGL